MRLKKLLLFCLIMPISHVFLYGQEKNNEKKEVVKPFSIQKHETVTPLEKMILVNARVNEIVLVVTNQKNQDVTITLKMGQSYEFRYTYPIVKIVCYEKLTPKTVIHKADAQVYKAFVFNDNQKTDKFHHLSIHEKNKALNHARQLGDISLFNDVCEETIYKL